MFPVPSVALKLDAGSEGSVEEVTFDLSLEEKDHSTLIHVVDIYRILNGAEGEKCELRQKSKWFCKRSS